jgi:hypothetical protein
LNLLPDSSDIFVTITSTYQHRMDLLSNNVYGTPDLWWVICEYNNIQDPLSQLTIGTVLRVPDLDRVLSLITT